MGQDRILNFPEHSFFLPRTTAGVVLMMFKPLKACRFYLASWSLAALMGCSATSDPATGDLELDLRHRDPRVRMEASYQAAAAGRMDLMGALIENLEDRDESVRFFAGIALKRMTGQDFGYRSFGNLAARKSAIEKWRRWHENLQQPPEELYGSTASLEIELGGNGGEAK